MYRVFRFPPNGTQPIDEPNLRRCLMMVNDGKAAVLQRQQTIDFILFYLSSHCFQRFVSHIVWECVSRPLPFNRSRKISIHYRGWANYRRAIARDAARSTSLVALQVLGPVRWIAVLVDNCCACLVFCWLISVDFVLHFLLFYVLSIL